MQAMLARRAGARQSIQPLVGIMAIASYSARLACGSKHFVSTGLPSGAQALAYPVSLGIAQCCALQMPKLRQRSSLIALRGGQEDISSGSSNISNIPGLTSLSLSGSTPSHVSVSVDEFGPEDFADLQPGLTREQAVKEFRREDKADAQVNSTSSENLDTSFVDSDEFIQGVDEFPNRDVRLFDYLVLGGGNAAGYALKELMDGKGIKGSNVCLVD